MTNIKHAGSTDPAQLTATVKKITMETTDSAIPMQYAFSRRDVLFPDTDGNRLPPRPVALVRTPHGNVGRLWAAQRGKARIVMVDAQTYTGRGAMSEKCMYRVVYAMSEGKDIDCDRRGRPIRMMEFISADDLFILDTPTSRTMDRELNNIGNERQAATYYSNWENLAAWPRLSNGDRSTGDLRHRKLRSRSPRHRRARSQSPRRRRHRRYSHDEDESSGSADGDSGRKSPTRTVMGRLSNAL